jgi:UrcA family protein
MNKLLISIGVLAFASQAANATPVIVEGNPAPFERVSVADLNLASQAGIATLRARIRSAANRVCVTNNVQPVAIKLRERSCYRTARTKALRDVDRLAAAQSKGGAIAALRFGSLR